jgi:hypothetical protein
LITAADHEQTERDGLAAIERAKLRAVADVHDDDPGPTESVDDERRVATAAPRRRIQLTPASAIEPKPVVWAWEESGEGRIPAGSITIAAGREGTGKSSFGLWMAAQITRGTLPGSLYGRPRVVFYVAVEDSWEHTLVPRLIAAGADRDMVYRCDVTTTGEDDLMLSLPSDNSMLEAAIIEHNVGLVVVDPLLSVIGEAIDTHRSRDVRLALDPLAKMCARTGAVLAGIAHFNKASGTDISNLITGSGAFKDVPRSVFGFARDDDGSSVMTQSKNSLGRYDLPSLSYCITNCEVPTDDGIANTARFDFTGTSERTVVDVLRDSAGPGASTEDIDERQAAYECLEGYLIDNGGEAPANDCLKFGQSAGYSRDALKRAKGKRIRSAKSGSAWVWQLVITDA